MRRAHRVTASAPAKINLYLGVGPLREDGFHPLGTVYQAVGVLDEVTVTRADAYGVSVTGDERLDLAAVPLDGSNIALRAARLLAERSGVHEPVEIHVHKRIPVAGGMAGGSADAAATLLACDALWGLGLGREALSVLAAELGSDVPFALHGGTAIGTGRGEVVVPAMASGEYWWVVVAALEGLATPAVYRSFDALHSGNGAIRAAEPDVPDELMEALRHHDVPRLGQLLHNDLEEAALRLRPALAETLAAGIGATSVGALLSGSGPTWLFLCSDHGHALRVAGDLSSAGIGQVSLVRGPVPGARIERTV